MYTQVFPIILLSAEIHIFFQHVITMSFLMTAWEHCDYSCTIYIFYDNVINHRLHYVLLEADDIYSYDIS